MCSARSRKRNRGAMLLLTSVLILVLIGVTALVVDLSQLHIAKQRAQNVCDASARAGAWYLEPGRSQLAGTKASSAAGECADANNTSSNRKVLQSDSSAQGVTVSFPTARTIQVAGDVRVNYGFARVLGFNSSRANATAKAGLAPSPGISAQFVPLGVNELLVEDDVDPGLSAQKTLVTDRWNPADGRTVSRGNLYTLALNDGTDVAAYQSQLQTPAQPFSLATGTKLAMRTGNVALATANGLNARIGSNAGQFSAWQSDYDVQKMAFPATNQLIIMPVIDSDDERTIVGFTGFYVESAAYKQADDRYKSEYAEVKGHFVPGVAGSKSIRWLWPFQPTSPNLIYRVRLTE